MPTVVKRSGTKKGSTAKASKTTGKPAATPKAKSNGGGKRGETLAKITADVKNVAKRLREGGKMKDEKARFGVSDDGPIRKALAVAGFDSKGGKLEVPTIANNPKAIVKARKEGTPWYLIELATGKPESELRAIVEKAGGPTGRVYRPKEKGTKAGR